MHPFVLRRAGTGPDPEEGNPDGVLAMALCCARATVVIVAALVHLSRNSVLWKAPVV